MEKATDELELQHLAGGDITKFPPLFSPDANCVFVVIDKGVQVFSATTGQPIRVLEGPDEPLISLEFDILDPRVLIACTKSGEVIRWKWSTGTIASRVNLTIKGVARFETFNLIDYFTNESSPCAFVTSVKQGNPLQWSLVDTVTGKVVHCVLSLRLGRQPVQVAVSKGHFKYFVVIQGAVLFYVDYESWTWLKLTNSEKVPFTCVNVNPKEHMVATGDEKGKISLWRQFFGTDAKVKVTLLHWHHTRVTSIAFSISGSILYSSGLESVLVKWNISRPEERFFVPRMSSVILHISASKENSNLAVCTADNGIQILDVDLKTKCTLQEFTYIYNDKTGNYAFPVGLRVNPRQNTLVLNGRTGHLQFYSPHTKSLLYNMDIVCQNQTSLESDKILYSICVSRAAFNIDWMATGEIFDDKQHIPELRLKFWEYQKEIQSYVLNTNVEIPHERGFVAIEFSSPFNIDNLLCATAGLDNIVKVWSLENSNNIYNEGKVWYCISQINYKNYPIKSVGFSQDGSLLAAGFGNTLCIYKTDNFKLLAALLPNGGFDSSLSKVQIRIPKINKNGFKSNSNSKKQDTIRSFVNLLQKSDESIIRNIQSSMKSKKLKELFSVEESTKKQLYKDIKSMSQLDLLQKLLIYQNLGLSFQLNEEWHTKMYEYIHSNILNNSKRKKFEKEVCCLSTQSRFKAKYRLNKFYRRKLGDDKRVNTDLQTLSAILKLKKSTNRHLTNGICENNQQQGSNRNPIPPLQSMTSIKNISFCYGDFAHLVVACTENRVLIWNLLTLRLQTVLKLTTEHIAIDAQTNLISVFTKNQELYVFLPGVALPVYFKSDMPRVNGMTWLPKKHPKSQAVIVNWQSRSTLYFLTDNNEIVYLGSKDDLEHTLPTYPNNTNVYAQQYSTFGALPANQFNNTEAQISSDQKISIGVHGKDAVKSFLEMSCHTMPPLRLLCNDFLKCVSQLNTNDKKESKKPSEANEENHNNDSTDEDEKIPLYNNPTEKLSESNIKKTKSKQNELSEEYLEKILAETIDVEF